MEDQGQKNGRMVNVEVSDGIDRSELFGGLDKNLRLIEENLKVDIIQRDDSLILKGEYASRAEKIIKEMMSVLEKGGKLDEQKINYIADLSDRGISYREENPGKDIICFTHEGKPLRAKTIGQKTYVDSIRKKDIVFGIGPAGTGKTYIAVAMAVNAFKNKQVQKIILARPAVEAGERLGFLPGDLQEKVDPYLRPLYDALYDVLGRESALRLKEKEERKEIRAQGSCRGAERRARDQFLLYERSRCRKASAREKDHQCIRCVLQGTSVQGGRIAVI